MTERVCNLLLDFLGDNVVVYFLQRRVVRDGGPLCGSLVLCVPCS